MAADANQVTRDAVEQKLTAARTWLIIDKPFLGALVLRLPMIEGDPDWCHSTATDARAFYYNRQYINGLTMEQTKFMLAHEALHCALSHFNRRQHRNKRRWDLACDYAINPLLLDEGLAPPSGALTMEEFRDMTAEEIYPFIHENTDDETLDHHLYDDQPPDNPPPPNRDQDESGQGPRDQNDDDQSNTGGKNPEAEFDDQAAGAPQPPPLSPDERESLGVQWQQRLAGAAQQALQAGKLKGSMARLVDHLLQPQLPWRMLLARYLTLRARTDYSFGRPSRREGKAILPSVRSQHIDIVVVLDTSGSIEDEEIQEFLSEIDAIKGQLNARITLHACDADLADEGPWIYEPWEEVELPREFHGGGGTRFTPAFEWAERLPQRPDLLLYFTDADGEFPEVEPEFPVLWLIKGKAGVPWGQRIQLN
jgi:predicted metal-dependent peptidase